MSEQHTPPGGPPNSEFREAIVELAKQAREDDERAEAEVKRRLTKRPFAQFVKFGVALIVLQAALYVYLTNRKPETVPASAAKKSLFPENNCNAVLYQTYWRIIAFQRDNGHPPAGFDQMLGKYLDKLPNDPVTGKPLDYSTDGKRFEVRCPGSPPGR